MLAPLVFNVLLYLFQTVLKANALVILLLWIGMLVTFLELRFVTILLAIFLVVISFLFFSFKLRRAVLVFTNCYFLLESRRRFIVFRCSWLIFCPFLSWKQIVFLEILSAWCSFLQIANSIGHFFSAVHVWINLDARHIWLVVHFYRKHSSWLCVIMRSLLIVKWVLSLISTSVWGWAFSNLSLDTAWRNLLNLPLDNHLLLLRSHCPLVLSSFFSLLNFLKQFYVWLIKSILIFVVKVFILVV